MTPTPRRLAATVLALGLVVPLSACGEDNPFGRIVKGQDPNATTSATEVMADITSATDTGSFSPSWSPTEESPAPTDTESSPTSTDTSTSTATDGTGESPSTAGTETSTGSTQPATSPTSTAAAEPSTSVVQVDGRTIAGIPAGLGFPSVVAVEGTSSFAAGGGSVVMSAPAEKEIFSFYRSALPSAGFRVIGDTAGTLTFTGKGFRGSLIGTGPGAVLTWTPAAG